MNKKPFFTAEEFKELQKEIDAGYINVNKHETADIWIYNYSKTTQYEWRWNKYTSVCRGLILDDDGCLVAKGFDKFFTDGQLATAGETLPSVDEPFNVYEKVDGSLGILYFVDDIHYISTRGSFVSDMAQQANGWLREQYGHIVFYPEYSYIFEIIYPENRIVVDYGDERKLVLLGVINNETQEELDIYDEEFDYIETQGLERVNRFDGFKDFTKILTEFATDVNNLEGFVIHFPKTNFRVKMKYEWYKNVAYIMQNFNKRGIWKMVRDGKQIDDIVKDISDEFYPLVESFVTELGDEYGEIYSEAVDGYNNGMAILNYGTDIPPSQKEVAMYFKETVNRKLFSLMMDFHNQKHDAMGKKIWTMIEPKYPQS